MLREVTAQGLLCCLRCRGVYDGQYVDRPLGVVEVLAEDGGGSVRHGFMGCGGCGARYPVIDGVPVLVGDLAGFVPGALSPLLARADLPGALTHTLLSALGDEHEAAWRRQMLAIYAQDLEPPTPAAPESGALGVALAAAVGEGRAFFAERQAALVQGLGEAPLVLDAGCGVGAQSLLAAAEGARVVALDRDVGPLRVLASLLRDGAAEVPRWRHGGNDYVDHRIERPDAQGASVLPIAADALAPPLGADCLDLALCTNLLDNVEQPLVLIRQLHALLKPGGVLALATPYDFVSRCTPPAHRLGEGIARNGPDPGQALRDLLLGQLPELAPELRFEVTFEREAVPWVLPRHRRSAHVFFCHYVEARVLA